MSIQSGFDTVNKTELNALLEPFGQTHLLNHWDGLSPDEQTILATQVQAVDFAQIQQLCEQKDTEGQWAELASKADVPPAITLADFQNPESYERAYKLGADAIAAGKVGMILTAGGQGSRLGFPHPKGMYKIGPVSDRSLYQIILEHTQARGKQFGSNIPMYVMTSPPTHAESSSFLREHNYFGYEENDCQLFCQGTMPAVDHEGKLILGGKGQLFLSPDGHGGMLRALEASGCLEDMANRGLEYIFYGQVDNPLIQVANPALIGYHIEAGSEMTTQVVRKNEPLQKVGNVVSVDGVVQIIEYSDLPEEYARQTDDDGSLQLWAGSIAVHIFNTSFLQRTSSQSDALPFHRAHKKVPFVNEAGDVVQPDENNAIKFERFIFDLLPWAKNAIVCEVAPEDGFCALKNAAPAASETPEHVRAAISDLHKRWLRDCGTTVSDDAVVEIAPSFAVDAKELAGKIEAGTVVENNQFFS